MDPGFRAAPPRIGPSTIARARIVDLLDERWDRAVISIVAGAGFGKSTLLAQAMASNAAEPRGQDVWLSLRPADNDASTLLAGLFQALDGEVPVDSELTVDSLTQQLWTRAPTHVALVLDDVHVLDPGSTGAAALAELLDAIPTNAHLVVASRRQPDLHLARLLAHDKVIELGEDHLRFTPSEQARLAARHGGGDGEGDLGGWAALLTLNQRFGLSRAADFAVEEVVSHLDEAERSYLLMAALLDGASPEQLVAIGSETGITPPDALDSTDHYHRLSNLPLVNAEPDGSIRPHHLWLDIFATTTDAEALGSTRRACADVLLRDGEPARAWELLAGAGDIETGLPALYDAINDQSNPPRVDQLERWRSAIPTTLTERAEVRYLEAIRLREVRPWSLDVDVEMTAAIEAFEQAGDIARQLGSAVRATFSIWLTCNHVRLADMGRIAEQFVDIVPGLKAISI
ncbi:MAG: hypothetical protein GY708_13505, partial [Actinomycetia bacterium]|nr:hypothetical protein [Actinomycetes bacterium]